MKSVMNKLVRDEKGAALIVALILLLVGGLLAASLLGYMGTGLITGEIYETRTAELYAADAGVEYAIWSIQSNNLTFDENNYAHLGPLALNDRVVEVEIYRQDLDPTCGEELRYQILSTAATDDGGGTAALTGTQIDAYVTAVSSNYTGLLDNVITSQNEITLQPGTEVDPPEGEHGPVEYYEGPWPTPEDLALFYWEDVKGETHYDGDTEIDLEGNSCPPGPIYINDEENNSWPSRLGPLYVDGGLEILNSIKTDPSPTLTLTGTLYITGDTLIGSTGKEFTLDLNGQTVFVASNSSDPQKALWIGGKCTIIGPGCIIAVGDVYFEPNIPVGMTDPIFIMSVSGETLLQPGGDFYGAIAGSVEVQLQPNTSLNYPEAGFGDGINFPGFVEPTQLVYSIESWEISQL